MTDVDQGVALDLDEPPAKKKRSMKSLALVGGAALLVIVGGAGAWYYLLGGKAHLGGGSPQKAEAPLPVFLELKPFVVTVESRNGPSRFVQLGLSFQVASAAAGTMINAILPQVQDALRETVLTFKAEDLQTPEGIDKVRAAMLARVNRVLVQVLGDARIEKANPEKPRAELVRNIYFPTLVVE